MDVFGVAGRRKALGWTFGVSGKVGFTSHFPFTVAVKDANLPLVTNKWRTQSRTFVLSEGILSQCASSDEGCFGYHQRRMHWELCV